MSRDLLIMESTAAGIKRIESERVSGSAQVKSEKNEI